MEFGLSEEQVLLRDSLARMLDDHCSLDALRHVVEAEHYDNGALWQQLVELGVTELFCDLGSDSGGYGFVDACVVAEVLGRYAAPVPFINTCVIAPLVLSKASKDLAESLLRQMSAGSISFGLAMSELTGARLDAGVCVSDGELNGRALFVTDIHADYFIVAADNASLFLVDRDSEGLTVAPLITVDKTRRLGELKFERVSATALVRDEPAYLSKIVDTVRVMYAADTLGAAQYMLDSAVQYAGEREQFGRVIASFQAVKHLCAEMAAELEPCRAMVWYAAHALDAIPEEAHLYACHSKAHLAEVGTFVAKTATEVHGGMGFTDLLGLHYWFKRIGLNRQLYGSPERARADAARAQGFLSDRS